MTDQHPTHVQLGRHRRLWQIPTLSVAVDRDPGTRRGHQVEDEDTALTGSGLGVASIDACDLLDLNAVAV